MAFTVPPLDSDTPSNVASSEATSTSTGAPGVGPSSENPQRDLYRHLPAQVKHCLVQVRRYFNMAIEDVTEPSIKTFLETCDTSPRVALIIATPALLAFLLALAFFVFSTLVVVLWSLLVMTTGVAFIIVDGIFKMCFKLLIVLVATIPLAGIAVALLVGANATSQFIIKKASQLPLGAATTNTGAPRAVGETDWTEMVATFGKLASQGVRNATPILLLIRDALMSIGHSLHASLQAAMLALHKEEITTSTSPAHQKESPADGKKVDGEYSPVLIHRELDAGTVERVSSRGDSSTKGLKRRAPFPNMADEGEEPK